MQEKRPGVHHRLADPSTLHANRRILAGMTEGTRHRWLAGIAAACVAVLAVACSNYQPNHIEFRFTPVPYTIRTAPDGSPVAFFNANATCEPLAADLVNVDLDPRERPGFERWLDQIGFTVRRKVELPQPPLTAYTIGVPGGATLDALPLIKKQRGVMDAEPFVFSNDLLKVGDDLATREAFFGCSAAR